MNLQHITFTGVDEHTSLKELQEIQKEFPIAEFGVLTSYKYAENGNRYPTPEFIDSLRHKGLNLALHICGRAAHDVQVSPKGWETFEETLGKSILDGFKRVQINVANRQDNPAHAWIPIIIGQELIIQSRNASETSFFEDTYKHWMSKPYPHRDIISTLIDPSGGHGKESTIELYKAPKYKRGYAGGISPDNVEGKLSFLIENEANPFWIDMESGVRTDDWFDLNKVYKVLTICRNLQSL